MPLSHQKNRFGLQKPQITGNDKRKKEEIVHFLKRRSFKVIFKLDIPAGANFPSGRFVLAVNYRTDGKIIFKVRYVWGGHRDKLKDFRAHPSSTLQQQSLRIMLEVSNILEF